MEPSRSWTGVLALASLAAGVAWMGLAVRPPRGVPPVRVLAVRDEIDPRTLPDSVSGVVVIDGGGDVEGGRRAARIAAWDDRHPATSARVPLPASGAGPIDVEIALDAALTVRGRVVCDGAPVAGARIGGAATSDAAGEFAWRTTSRTAPTLAVRAQGFVPREFDVAPPAAAAPPPPPLDTTPRPGGCEACCAAAARGEPDDEPPVVDPPPVVCELERAGDLAGRVVGIDGVSLRGVVVERRDASRIEESETLTDADGRFTFRDVALRAHVVTFRSRDGVPAPIARFAARIDPRDPPGPDLVARQGRSVSGRVEDLRADRDASLHAEWRLIAAPGGPGSTDPEASGRADVLEDGTFEITGLGDGEVEVSAGDHRASGRPVRVPVGTTDVRLVVR